MICKNALRWAHRHELSQQLVSQRLHLEAGGEAGSPFHTPAATAALRYGPISHLKGTRYKPAGTSNGARHASRSQAVRLGDVKLRTSADSAHTTVRILGVIKRTVSGRLGRDILPRSRSSS